MIAPLEDGAAAAGWRSLGGEKRPDIQALDVCLAQKIVQVTSYSRVPADSRPDYPWARGGSTPFDENIRTDSQDLHTTKGSKMVVAGLRLRPQKQKGISDDGEPHWR